MITAPTLRDKRIALGLTLAQTAAKAEVSTQHLSGVESGEKRLTVAVALRLGAALGFGVDEVLGEQVGVSEDARHAHELDCRKLEGDET